MSEDKAYPTYRLTFSEAMQDERGYDKLGKPVEIATAWPRKNGKKGSTMEWHLPRDKLKDGVYFLLDADREQKAPLQRDENTPSHIISFAQQKANGRGQGDLGSPVEVATVWPRKNGKQGGIVQWHISPQSLGEGAFFLLDNERQQSQQAGVQQETAQPKPDKTTQFDRVDTCAAEKSAKQGLGY